MSDHISHSRGTLDPFWLVICCTLQEARSLHRCRAVGIDVPAIVFLDENAGRIFMECVDGVTLKEYIFANTDAAGA